MFLWILSNISRTLRNYLLKAGNVFCLKPTDALCTFIVIFAGFCWSSSISKLQLPTMCCQPSSSSQSSPYVNDAFFYIIGYAEMIKPLVGKTSFIGLLRGKSRCPIFVKLLSKRFGFRYLAGTGRYRLFFCDPYFAKIAVHFAQKISSNSHTCFKSANLCIELSMNSAPAQNAETLGQSAVTSRCQLAQHKMPLFVVRPETLCLSKSVESHS